MAKLNNSHLYNFINLNFISDSNINGQIPQISETKQYKGITLIKYKISTGCAYNRIIFTNNEGNNVEGVITLSFEMSMPEIEAFNKQINKINDLFFKNYLQYLHNKWLIEESKTLADHLTENSNCLHTGGLFLAYYRSCDLLFLV
jgi:hypothetical protein